jgi:hypothetical protein
MSHANSKPQQALTAATDNGISQNHQHTKQNHEPTTATATKTVTHNNNEQEQQQQHNITKL